MGCFRWKSTTWWLLLLATAFSCVPRVDGNREAVIQQNTTIEAPYGGQWGISYQNDYLGESHATAVTSMAYDPTGDSVYMIGNVGSVACWLGVLNLQTQELYQQVFVSPSYGDDDISMQVVCGDLLVQSSGILVLGHTTKGDGLLNEPPNSPENEPGISGMVLHLQRANTSQSALPASETESSTPDSSNIFSRTLRDLADIFGLPVVSSSRPPPVIVDPPTNTPTAAPRPPPLIVDPPTVAPTVVMADDNTTKPTEAPSEGTETSFPTLMPSLDSKQTLYPTLNRQNQTSSPTDIMTLTPTVALNETDGNFTTLAPSILPSNETLPPTFDQGNEKTLAPTILEGNATAMPTIQKEPPTMAPSQSSAPTLAPTRKETFSPTTVPSTISPTFLPTDTPSTSAPTILPTPPIGPEEDAPAFVIAGGSKLEGSVNVFSVSLTGDDNFVYIASLESNSTSDMSALALRERSRLGLGNQNLFHLMVRAMPLPPESSGVDSESSNSLGPALWTTNVMPFNTTAVVGVGGILQQNNALLLVGTIHEGTGGSLDGFVTRISKDSGRLFGTEAATSGLTPSLRISSGNGLNDIVHGVCSVSNLFFYITGSVTDESDNSNNHAFLTKIRAEDLSPVWTVKLHATQSQVPEIEGISCAVTQDGASVYFVGNVMNIGEAKDVFIAMVDDESGDILFKHHFSSQGDDFVASGQGIYVASSGDAIIAGNSNGALFNERDQAVSLFSDQYDVFVALIKQDGSFPPTLYSPPPSASPTLPPTPESQGFVFKSLSVRLDGAKPLSSETRLAFEQTMETFYHNFYSENNRRRLFVSDIISFSTSVTAVGEWLDDTGNEIRYDQRITVRFPERNITVDEAETLLLAPFQFFETRELFVAALRSNHSGFRPVTSVGIPEISSSGDAVIIDPESNENDKGGLTGAIADNIPVVLIALGVLIFCGCSFLALHYRRRQGLKRREEQKANIATTVSSMVPTEEVRPGLEERLSRARHHGDYSSAYLKDLDDFGQGGVEYAFNQSYGSNDYTASSSSEPQVNPSHEKMRVKLPGTTRSRSRSRESRRVSQDISMSEDSDSSAWTASNNDDDKFYDEEMPTPRQSGLISDLDDGGEYSESYNSFIEKFDEEASEVAEFPNGPDLEEGSLPASVHSNLSPRIHVRLQERRKQRERRRRNSGSSYQESVSQESLMRDAASSDDSDSDSDPHIKVQEEPDDMSSFTAESFAGDWVKGM